MKYFEKAWGNPAAWPIDPSGYVFLARALNEIGRAKFGSEWDRKVPPDPDDNEDDDDDSAEGLAAWSQAPEAWEKADAEARATSASMRMAVWREISEQCLSGHLVTAVRSTRGGPMTVLAADNWNTENLDNRFQRLQMSPSQPFAERSVADTGWIYVDRESLDKYLAGQPYAAPNVANSVHLSPYLKLMLAIAKDMNIAPDRQPKKEQLIATLESKWTGPDKLSKNLLSAMATLLREPDSQLGSASRNRRKN